MISRSVITKVWDPAAELKEVEKKLTEEKKIIAAPGIDVKIRAVSVLEGDVARIIQKVAEEEKVSLVAMGARGKSRIERFSWEASSGALCALEIRIFWSCFIRF